MKKKLLITLIPIFLFSLIFRGFAISEKEVFSHDETISTLVATGNQGVYHNLFNSEEGDKLLNNWVSVDDWKFLVERPKTVNFNLISKDLGNHDIHPPLYYWLLHIIYFLFGSSIWSGAILNLVIYSATFFVVYLFFKTLKVDENTLFLTMFLWAFSPAVIHSVYEARHYELTTLLSFLLLFFVIRLIQSRNENNILSITVIFIVSFAGILTNYMFSIVAGAAILIIGLKFYHTKAKQYLAGVVSIVLGLASIVVVHPQVLNIFGNTGSGTEEVSAFINTIHAYLGFFSADVISRYLTLVLFFILVALIFLDRKINYGSVRRFFTQENTIIIVAFYILVGGMIHLTYFLSLTPPHSVGVQYWNMFWPLFAYLIALIFTQFDIRGKHLLVASLFVLMIYSLFTGINENDYKLRSWDPEIREQVANAEFIITDQNKRGLLPALIFKVPADKNIYVSDIDINSVQMTILKDYNPDKVILISENIIESIVINDQRLRVKKIENEILYKTYVYSVSKI